MAKRPNDIMNWAGRQFDSFGPYLSIETGNPEMGMKGATFWCIHGTNASGDQSSMSMNASGDFNIMNDGQISITGGKKIDGGGINIMSQKGGVKITVAQNGDIQLGVVGKGDIILDGDNIRLNARNDIIIKAANSLLLSSNIMNRERAQTGNMCVECFGKTIQKGTLLKTPSSDLLSAAAGAAISSQTGGLL